MSKANLGPVSYTHLDVYKRQVRALPARLPLGARRKCDSMMKPLDIDFVDRSLWRRPLASRQRQILIGIGVAEALTALVVVWQWRQLDGQLDETKQAIALARQEIVARTPPVPAPLLLSEPQIVAINSAIGQLNTPWPALLDGFERVASTCLLYTSRCV